MEYAIIFFVATTLLFFGAWLLERRERKHYSRAHSEALDRVGRAESALREYTLWVQEDREEK